MAASNVFDFIILCLCMTRANGISELLHALVSLIKKLTILVYWEAIIPPKDLRGNKQKLPRSTSTIIDNMQ